MEVAVIIGACLAVLWLRGIIRIFKGKGFFNSINRQILSFIFWMNFILIALFVGCYYLMEM